MEEGNREYLRNVKGSGKTEENLKKIHPEIYDAIIGYQLNRNNPKIPFNEKVYYYVNKIDKLIVCEACGNSTKYLGTLKKGFSKYCSTKCAANSNEVRKKIKTTNIEKYGVESPLQNDIILNKQKLTNIEKYGVEYPFQSEEIKEKIKLTNIEKYGVENPFQSEEIKEKIKLTNIEKYGVENPSQCDDIKKKKNRTSVINYGCDYYTQTIDYKKRIDDNFINKFINLNVKFHSITDGLKIYEVLDNCKKHKSFLINKYTLYNRYFVSNFENLCTICNPPEKYHISNFQIEIEEFLKNNNIKYVKNDRSLIKPFEIDMYLPDYNIGIELNGDYYHSNKYKSDDYHMKKTEMASNLNIKLLHLWSSDYQNKKNIVLSILSSKLNILEKKIYARKCNICLVDYATAKKFYNENHLQGYVISPINIGLYYENNLVSIMGFGKLRKNLNTNSIDNVYELYRFCNKINYSVIGGASKLLKCFIQEYKPKKIISYANNDISDGNLYEKLGFKLIAVTKPTYWWVKNNVKINRYNVRKNQLIKQGYDENKTESEIMMERGYCKVYNSGNLKYAIDF